MDATILYDTLINALTTGAAKGLTESATSAVKGLYTRLKALCVTKSPDSRVDRALDDLESSIHAAPTAPPPESESQTLHARVAQTSLAADPEIQALVRELQAALAAAGHPVASTATATATGAHGVAMAQSGDHATAYGKIGTVHHHHS